MRINNENWRAIFKDCPVVTLDGKPIDHVVEADDELGYVIVVVYGDDGAPKINSVGDAILTKKVTGFVRIIGKFHPSVK